MYEKLKAYAVKYKWWIVGAVALLATWLIFRGSGSGGGYSDVMQGTGPMMVGVDNTMGLAQMEMQTQLSMQNAQLQGELEAGRLQLEHQLAIEQLGFDAAKYSADSQLQLGNLQADLQKYITGIESQTQLGMADIQSQASRYTSDVNLQISQQMAQVEMTGIEAGRYIAGKEASIKKYDAKTNRYNALTGSIIGIGNAAKGWGLF